MVSVCQGFLSTKAMYPSVGHQGEHDVSEICFSVMEVGLNPEFQHFPHPSPPRNQLSASVPPPSHLTDYTTSPNARLGLAWCSVKRKSTCVNHNMSHETNLEPSPVHITDGRVTSTQSKLQPQPCQVTKHTTQTTHNFPNQCLCLTIKHPMAHTFKGWSSALAQLHMQSEAHAWREVGLASISQLPAFVREVS